MAVKAAAPSADPSCVDLGLYQPPEGVRLLSHRPSILAKLVPLAGERPARDADLAGEGLEVGGADWQERLTRMLDTLTGAERDELYAVWLADELALPLPAAKILDQALTAWFPAFLVRGRWIPHFQPIVELATSRPIGHEVLMRGRLDGVDHLGGELVRGARAHDSTPAFDRRARMVGLEIGLPLTGPGELLFVNLAPRAVVDLESSLTSTWPTVLRNGSRGSRICLDLVSADTVSDLGMLTALACAHRERGARIALDDLSGGPASLACLEAVRPDFAKLDVALIAAIHRSPARRQLAGALVDLAHEVGARVIAEGIEDAAALEAALELGIDCGQGHLIGAPSEQPSMAAAARRPDPGPRPPARPPARPPVRASGGPAAVR